MKVLSLTMNVNDAAPGVVLFFIGFLVILVTRFDVSIDERSSRDNKKKKPN